MSPNATSTSTRWSPTPEQLMILEELYRTGTRTPNAPQIQKITAHLSSYGKIQGKNVFYWFQNHKARDRQKLRRRFTKQLQEQQHQQLVYDHLIGRAEQIDHQFVGRGSGCGCFDPPRSAINQLGCYSSAHSANFLLPPGGHGHEIAPTHLTNYSWKAMNNHHKDMKAQVETSMKRMYGHDWMMMMVDMTTPASCPLLTNSCSTSSSIPCITTTTTTTTRPLKTLELFPIKSTNLKE